MFTISEKQFDALDDQFRKAYLLEVIGDWHAIHQRVYGQQARLSFDEAWEAVADLPPWVEELPQQLDCDPTYLLIHRVLSATEAGTPPAQIEEGFDAFAGSMPAHGAALALFDLHSGLVKPVTRPLDADQ